MAGVGLACALLVGASPYLLGTPPARPVLERILASRLGFSVGIDDASLGWRGPQVLRGFAVASADGFGDVPLFGAASAELDASFAELLTLTVPREVRLERPALQVVRAPGGSTNLEHWRARHPEWPGSGSMRLVVRGGSARIEDRATDTRLDADGIEATIDARRATLRARVAGEHGVGRLVLERDVTDDGTRVAHVEAHGFDLGELEPLLRPWLPSGARLAGTCALDFSSRRAPDGFVEFDGAGQVRGLAVPSSWLADVGVPVALAPGEIADPQLSFEGRVTLDPPQRSVSFERFAFRSSFVEITADGAIAEGATTPLTGRAAVNFDMLARRGAPLLGSVLPFRGGTGYVEVSVEPAPNDAYRVVARGERAAFVVTGGMAFDGPATALEAVARFDAGNGTFRLDDAKLETRGGTLTGRLDWRGPDDCDGAVRWVGDWEPVESFIAQWEFGTFWDGGGEFDATATWSRRGSRSTLGLDVASSDLALQFSPRDGNFVLDDYFFRGTPFTAKVTAEFDPTASRSTWSGSVLVDAPGAVIRDDTFEKLGIAARLDAGVITIDRCEGLVHGGRFRAGGSITLKDGGDADMQFTFDGEDLALGGHASEWSGQICPVFATKGGPYRVKGSPRLSGSIAVTGTGYGLRSLARNATGGGTMTWSAGTLTGSDLLARVATDSAAGDGIRIDGITAEVRIDNARVATRSVVALPQRPELVIEGSVDWAGNYDYRVGARSLLPQDLFERHRARLESVAFPVRGNSARPQLEWPDIGRWIELDAKGELATELDRIAGSRPR